MKSMKMTKQEKTEKSAAVPMGPMDDAYPYGLRLTLDKDTLEKLGLKLPAVGEKLSIVAVGCVKSVHASENASGDKYASCDVQIEEMEAEAESPMEKITERLYKK